MEGSLTNQQGNGDRSNGGSHADSVSLMELSSSNKHVQNSHPVISNMVIVDPSYPKTQSPSRDNSSTSLHSQPNVPSSSSSPPVAVSSQAPPCPLARNNEEHGETVARLSDRQSCESDSDDDSELAGSIEIAEEGEDGVISVSSEAPRLLIIDDQVQNANKAGLPHRRTTAGASMESETPVVSSEVEKNKSDMSALIQVSLNGANTSRGDVKATATAITNTAKPTGGPSQRTIVTSSINGVAGHRVLSQPARCKQSAKVKQCFTTLQTFGNNMSRDVADQVHELISALVVSAPIILAKPVASC